MTLTFVVNAKVGKLIIAMFGEIAVKGFVQICSFPLHKLGGQRLEELFLKFLAKKLILTAWKGACMKMVEMFDYCFCIPTTNRQPPTQADGIG